MAADVAQYESSRIKRYASAFSNILIRYLVTQQSAIVNTRQWVPKYN